MNGGKLVIPIFILGVCFIIPLAVILINIRLAKDIVESVRRRIGSLHQVREPIPIIDFFPSGDIPQPETSKVGKELSLHR